MTYQAFYARQFHEQLMELPDSVYDKVEHSIDMLVDNPGLLRDYDPPYEAATPPVDCKWHYVPSTYKVLYLTVDEATLQMRFLFLGDTRCAHGDGGGVHWTRDARVRSARGCTPPPSPCAHKLATANARHCKLAAHPPPRLPSTSVPVCPLRQAKRDCQHDHRHELDRHGIRDDCTLAMRIESARRARPDKRAYTHEHREHSV